MITEEVWGGGAGIAVVVRGGAGIAVVVRGAGIAVVVRGDNCGCGVTLQLRHQHNALGAIPFSQPKRILE